MSQEKSWLIWDGKCGFCRRWAEWVRARDRNGVFEIIPYQDAPSPPMSPELYERSRRAVQVVTPEGDTIGAGRAVAFVLGKLGWRRLSRLMTARGVLPIVEWGYRHVANNRGWLGRILFRPARTGRAHRTPADG